MTVYDGNSEKDKILNQRVINYLSPRARRMLAKTSWWAMHEGHEIVTRPLDEGERVKVVDTWEDCAD